MATSNHDKSTVSTDQSDAIELVQACVDGKPFAWQKFVDQYLGTVIQVIDQLAESTSSNLAKTDRELAAKTVFQTLRADNCAVLRQYREFANFETFLVLVTRRVMKAPATESNDES